MHSQNSIKTIRSAARAIIIKNDSVLMVQMQNDDGEFFILPGGGQLHGETLVQAVARECMEELGIIISVGRLIYTREYIGKNHQFDQQHDNFHQIEHVFICEINNDTLLGNGQETDKKQIGYRWIKLNELSEYKVLPSSIKSLLQAEDLFLANTYLGDIN
ncbi:MAG: NUDIX domain-containing protein [Opitutae bacterium]|jgi:ADP-ribose pyrophosphatase YjhB (NUDIX family)|nr:NUDIX domain-containing protein [Opitutae bacterium]